MSLGRARRSLQQPVEDVADNAINGRVARFQPIRPVAAADGDHGPVAGIGADGGVTILFKVVGYQVTRLHRPGLANVMRPLECPLWRVPAGGSGGDDHKISGRSVAPRGDRQSILPDDLTTVAFIAADAVFGTELVTLSEPGTCQDPVVGSMDGVLPCPCFDGTFFCELFAVVIDADVGTVVGGRDMMPVAIEQGLAITTSL